MFTASRKSLADGNEPPTKYGDCATSRLNICHRDSGNSLRRRTTWSSLFKKLSAKGRFTPAGAAGLRAQRAVGVMDAGDGNLYNISRGFRQRFASFYILLAVHGKRGWHGDTAANALN